MSLCEQIVRNRLLLNVYYHDNPRSYEISLIDTIANQIVGTCLYNIDQDHTVINPRANGYPYVYSLRRMISALDDEISQLQCTIDNLEEEIKTDTDEDHDEDYDEDHDEDHDDIVNTISACKRIATFYMASCIMCKQLLE